MTKKDSAKKAPKKGGEKDFLVVGLGAAAGGASGEEAFSIAMLLSEYAEISGFCD